MCSACSGDYENPNEFDETQVRTARLSLWAQSRNAIAAQDAPREELSAEERLAAPKCLAVGASERLEQVVKSAMAGFMVHIDAEGR